MVHAAWPKPSASASIAGFFPSRRRAAVASSGPLTSWWRQRLRSTTRTSTRTYVRDDRMERPASAGLRVMGGARAPEIGAAAVPKNLVGRGVGPSLDPKQICEDLKRD